MTGTSHNQQSEELQVHPPKPHLLARIVGFRRGVSEWIKAAADDYAAGRLYEQLSRLSDAELERRGFSRGDLARHIMPSDEAHDAASRRCTPSIASRPLRHSVATRPMPAPSSKAVVACRVSVLVLLGAGVLVLAATHAGTGSRPTPGASTNAAPAQPLLTPVAQPVTP